MVRAKVTARNFKSSYKFVSGEEKPRLTAEQLAEFVLRDYNQKHGTDLEFVRFLPGRIRSMYCCIYCIDFVKRFVSWTHFNFEARRHNAVPTDEPLLLFAEVHMKEGKPCLTRLSPVNPTDKANGCQSCWSNMPHPRRGFRADASMVTSRCALLLKDASKFSKLALELYNERNGTDLKFLHAMGCNRFISVGLLNDFTEKKTSWLHMNFEARVDEPDCEESTVRLFAELYLGDDGNYVLATLLATEPRGISPQEKKKLEVQCPCCPANIYHPWREYHFGFDLPPRLEDIPPRTDIPPSTSTVFPALSEN